MKSFWRSSAIFENDQLRISETKTSHNFFRHSLDDDSEVENAANDSDGHNVDYEGE